MSLFTDWGGLGQASSILTVDNETEARPTVITAIDSQ